jgi:predicted RND superfamily exporter protein
MIHIAKGFWADVCLTYRKSVLFALACITALAVSQFPSLQFENAMDIWFLDDDPTYLAHREMIDTYVSDELIVVGIEAPDVFAPDILALIDRLGTKLERAPHVEKVISLTNVESITGHEDSLDIRDLIELPVDPADLPAIREKALSNKFYVGNIVSAGGDFTLVLARLPSIPDDFDYKVEAIEAVNEILATEPDTRFFLSGGAPVDYEFYKLAAQDSTSISVLTILFVTGALWFLLGSLSGVLLAIATVVLSAVWAHGWIALYGAKLNMISSMMPGLLIAVGVADSMHVLVEYQNKLQSYDDKFDALKAVYMDLMSPLALTTLTTAIGLTSLSISKIQGIREFGAFAALGVAGAFVLSITLVPIVLSYLPRPQRARSRRREVARSARMLTRLHELTMSHGRAIVGISAIVVVVSVYGATLVKTESDFIEAFPDDYRSKIDTRYIESKMGGIITLDVLVDAGVEGGVKEPETLRALAALQDHLMAEDQVGATQSIADSVKDMRRAFHANDQREYRLPETREEAAQYLLLYEMDAPDGDLKEFVTYDYQHTRVSARALLDTSSDAYVLCQRADAWIDENLAPLGITGQVTGMIRLFAEMEEYIRSSLVQGFSLALFLIFLVFCVQLRSVALGAIAMIPNIVPIVVSLGIMGYAGISLDSMTCMVASIAIGLAVDDSIHFVSRIRRRLTAGLPMRESLAEATVDVGRALVYTSITLCCGFGVMMIATFIGIFYFGLLCTVTVAAALVADLLLLPVVFRWYGALRGEERLTENRLEPSPSDDVETENPSVIRVG